MTNVYSSAALVVQELQTFSPPAAMFTCSYLRPSDADATRRRCHSTVTAAYLLDNASPALMVKTQVFWATTLYSLGEWSRTFRKIMMHTSSG